MKGTIYKATSKSGRTTWRYQIDAGRDESGKRICISESGFKLERLAHDAMQRRLREVSDNELVKPSPQTVGEFMAEWMREHAERHCSPKTTERYAQLLRHYLLPHI